MRVRVTVTVWVRVGVRVRRPSPTVYPSAEMRIPPGRVGGNDLVPVSAVPVAEVRG